MGLWNFYFLAKFYWFIRGYIHFDYILNMLFFAFLLLPLAGKLKHHQGIKIFKTIIGIALALLLLWHDSWLPTIQKSFFFLLDEGIPVKEYLYRFLTGFVNPLELFLVLLLFFLCYMANRAEIRITPFVFLLLLYVPIANFSHSKNGPDKILKSFFQSESNRVIHFKKQKDDQMAFDIIFLHVCSLSWDDLKAVRLDEDPFFNQFDYVFTHFNSVTSYSGPAMIRVLREACGQTLHEELYRDAPEGCYLFDRLKDLGYSTYGVLNHDGTYAGFATDLETLGHLSAPILPVDQPVQGYSFDGSPVYDDYAVLEKWWNLRQATNVKKAAAYYNTISLHDGTHLASEKDWWKKDRNAQYHASVIKLFSDLKKFIDLLNSSGKKGVVIFVPEHGMALRGNRVQVQGLREIPFPQITTVPVAVKLIGFNRPKSAIKPKIISKQVSYLSLSYFLASLLNLSQEEVNEDSIQDIFHDLPETNYVSENEGNLILKTDEEYFLLGKEKRWVQLSTDLANE